jgi:CheY-like chemotaxis protein
MTDQKKTILVVDDETDIRDYISTVLEDNGFDTLVAADGQQALESIKKGKPDLITLDVSMPERSGVRFYRDVKESEEYKKIPVVIISGVDASFEKFISSRHQVPPPDGYIRKPIDQAELVDLVRKLTSS